MIINPMPRYKCDKCGKEADAKPTDNGGWEIPSGWEQYYNGTAELTAREHCCPDCVQKRNKLRPCPFCEKDAEVQIRSGTNEYHKFFNLFGRNPFPLGGG